MVWERTFEQRVKEAEEGHVGMEYQGRGNGHAKALGRYGGQVAGEELR